MKALKKPSVYKTRCNDTKLLRQILEKHITTTNAVQYGERMHRSRVDRSRLKEHLPLIKEIANSCMSWSVTPTAVQAALDTMVKDKHVRVKKGKELDWISHIDKRLRTMMSHCRELVRRERSWFFKAWGKMIGEL
eukprot:4341407-Pyramimonas_sp.AAC.1